METTTVGQHITRGSGPCGQIVTEDHAALLERARCQDQAAFGELVRRFTPLVESTARRRCVRAAEVDDVVQEVWIALFRHLDAIHSPACLPGWLRRVALNFAAGAERRDRSILMADTPEPMTETDDDPMRVAIVDARRTNVRRAISRLPEPDQALLNLLMLDSHPNYRVVSIRVGRPIGSLGPTRGRLLRRLRNDPDIISVTAR